MSRGLTGLNSSQKKFMNAFDRLTYSRSGWEVWGDFVTVAACSLANSVDRSPKWDKREKLYLSIVKRYKKDEVDCFAQMLAATVNAFEQNPEQDFLGTLFQLLELNSHWHGQFFTPYSVCKMMSEMQLSGNEKAEIKHKGYISVNDSACGAGATLIAFANVCRQPKININYQQNVLFVAQDIDFTAAMMCYIQLSLLGCPGYVIVGDTLAHPPIVPLSEDYEVWYTPMYFSSVWQWRSVFHKLNELVTEAPKSVINNAKPYEKATKALSKPLKTYKLPEKLKVTESGQMCFKID